MITAKYSDSASVLDITKFENPRQEIDKSRVVCRFCDGRVIIKHGLTKAKHFAHCQSCTSNFDRHPESAEHNLGKELIAKHVKQSWAHYADVEVAFEYPIPEIKRIADVAMIFPSGWVVVHEIQLANITSEQLQKRTDDYNSAGIDSIWWLGKGADSPANRKWSIEQYGYSLAIDYEILKSNAQGLQRGISSKPVQ